MCHHFIWPRYFPGQLPPSPFQLPLPADNGSVPARGCTTKRALPSTPVLLHSLAVELSIFKLFKEEAAIFLKLKKNYFCI